MALELATAIVRIRVDKAELTKQLRSTKKLIQRHVGRVNVMIVPRLDMRRVRQIRASLNSLGTVTGGGGGGGGGGPIGVPRPTRTSSRGSFFGTTTTNHSYGGGGGGGGGGGFGGPGTAGFNRNANVTGGASRVKGGAQLLGGDIAGFAKGSMQIATGILGAQAALALLSFPIRAFQEAAAFEQAMIDVEIATGAGADEMERIKQATKELTLGTKFMADEVGTAMSMLARKGLEVQEVLDIAPHVLAIATVADVSASQAGDVLVGIKNSMKLAAHELEDAANVLARISIKSSANFKQFSEAFKYVGPLAELGGMDFSEVASIIGVLADSELKGSLGGTGIRTMLLELSNTDKIVDIGKMIGKDFSSTISNGDFRKFPDIIDEIASSLQQMGIEGTGVIDFARQIFNKRGAAAFAVVLEAGGDALRKMQIDATTGITALEAARMKMDSLKGTIDRLRSAWSIFSIQVIEPFKGLMKGVGSSITDVIASFIKMEKAVPQFITLTAAIAGLAFVTMFAGKAFLFLGRSAFTLIFSKAGLIIGIFAGIAAAIVYMWGEGETFRDKMKDIFAVKIPAFIELAKFAIRNLPLIMEMVAINMVLTLFDAFPKLVGVFEMIGAVAIGIFDGLTAGWEAFLNYFLGGLKEIGNVAKALAVAIKTGSITKGLEVFTNQEDVEAGKSPLDAFGGAFKKSYKNAMDGFDDIPMDEALSNRLTEIFGEIAANEVEYKKRKAAAGVPGRGGGGGRGAAGSFTPRFVGLEALAKQVQVTVSDTDKNIEKNTKDTAESTKKSEEYLKELASNANGTAVFG